MGDDADPAACAANVLTVSRMSCDVRMAFSTIARSFPRFATGTVPGISRTCRLCLDFGQVIQNLRCVVHNGCPHLSKSRAARQPGVAPQSRGGRGKDGTGSRSAPNPWSGAASRAERRRGDRKGKQQRHGGFCLTNAGLSRTLSPFPRVVTSLERHQERERQHDKMDSRSGGLCGIGV